MRYLEVPGHRWLLLGGGLWVVAAGLTGYIVARINIELFFKAQTNLERVECMLQRWMRLNVIRIVSLAGSAAGWVLGIRSLLRG